MYIIPYVADYECERGHKFTAKANPGQDDMQVMCTVCYDEWLSKFPRAKQVTMAVVDKAQTSYLCD